MDTLPPLNLLSDRWHRWLPWCNPSVGVNAQKMAKFHKKICNLCVNPLRFEFGVYAQLDNTVAKVHCVSSVGGGLLKLAKVQKTTWVLGEMFWDLLSSRNLALTSEFLSVSLDASKRLGYAADSKPCQKWVNPVQSCIMEVVNSKLSWSVALEVLDHHF